MLIAFIITVAVVVVFILLELLREKLKIDEAYFIGFGIVILLLILWIIVEKLLEVEVSRCTGGCFDRGRMYAVTINRAIIALL